jgi:NTE family protein
MGEKLNQKNSKSEAARKPLVALVLQGGGALGAYHIGAYQALEEAGYAPDWVAGISIGAINSAIIVGNRPADRLAKLEQLWTEISWPNEWGGFLKGRPRRFFNEMSAAAAFVAGQPNFWFPRPVSPALLPQVATEQASYYDTSPMRNTLQRLVDFDLINMGEVRISLGATEITSGELQFFDNRGGDAIGPEHVLASGSLPPGFAATRVGDKLYWDGGCVSNTPLDAVYQDTALKGEVLVFMIDLWSRSGEPPDTMDLVMWRQKQIQYASRSQQSIDSHAIRDNMRQTMARMAAQMPRAAAHEPMIAGAAAMRSDKTIDIVHVIYHPSPDQISSSDAEFSRPSIEARRAAGYADLQLAMRAKPWRAARMQKAGTMVHRLSRGNLMTMATQ